MNVKKKSNRFHKIKGTIFKNHGNLANEIDA